MTNQRVKQLWQKVDNKIISWINDEVVISGLRISELYKLRRNLAIKYNS